MKALHRQSRWRGYGKRHQLLVHDKKDTVGVVVVEGLKAGTDMLCVVTADNSQFTLKAKADVPIGHKIAPGRHQVRRYGLEIRPRHRQGRRQYRQGRTRPTSTISRPNVVSAMAQQNVKTNGSLHGWRRENGRVGVRNHVVILPLDDLSNAACESVANNIKGTMALPHAYGRLQFGEDLEVFFRTLIGTGANPNVAAVVVIGIEDGWTKRVVDGIKKTGKPVEGFGIEGTGDIMTVAKASRTAKDFPAMGLRTAAREMRSVRAMGVCQMRRERHHDRAPPPARRRQHV